MDRSVLNAVIQDRGRGGGVLMHSPIVPGYRMVDASQLALAPRCAAGALHLVPGPTLGKKVCHWYFVGNTEVFFQTEQQA